MNPPRRTGSNHPEKNGKRASERDRRFSGGDIRGERLEADTGAQLDGASAAVFAENAPEPCLIADIRFGIGNPGSVERIANIGADLKVRCFPEWQARPFDQRDLFAALREPAQVWLRTDAGWQAFGNIVVGDGVIELPIIDGLAV
jgi:hypothetical protein